MKTKLAVATSLLVGLVFLGWWKDKKELAKMSLDEKNAKVLGVKMDDLEKMIFTSSNYQMEFQKRPKNDKGEYTDEFAPLNQEFSLISEWLMVKPVRSLLDYSTWTSLVNNLDELKSTKLISDKLDSAQVYNLKDPTPLMLEMFKSASATKPDEVFRLGDENTAQTGFYASSLSAAKIFLIDNKLQFAKSKKLLDWRDSRLIGFKEMGKVKRVTTYKNGKLLFDVDKKDGHWSLVSPMNLPASTSSVEAYLNVLDGAKMKDVVSEDVKLVDTSLGLSNPALEIRVLVDEMGQEMTKVVKLSTKGSKEGSIVFHRSGLPQVSFVNESLLKELSKNPEELISKKVIDLTADQLSRISVVINGKETHEFTKKDSDWIYGSGKENKKFQGVFKLSSLEGTSFLGKVFPRALGSLPTQADLLFTLVAGDQTEHLKIFKKIGPKDKKVLYVAKIEPKGFYYELTAADVEGIEASIEEVLDKKEAHSIETPKGP